MFLINKFGTIRGALANGLLWGLGWAGLGFVLLGTMFALGLAPPRGSWLRVVILSVKFGIIGVPAGIAFSLVMAFIRRRAALLEMNPVRAGILGATFAAVFIPLFMQVMNILSGDGMVAWRLVLDDSAWAAVFGAIAAVATFKLARRGRKTDDRSA